jgi:hypothetical protein
MYKGKTCSGGHLDISCKLAYRFYASSSEEISATFSGVIQGFHLVQMRQFPRSVYYCSKGRTYRLLGVTFITVDIYAGEDNIICYDKTSEPVIFKKTTLVEELFGGV